MGVGPMFPGQYKDVPEIDEHLLGRIAQLVDREYRAADPSQGEVAQQADEDGLYGRETAKRRQQRARDLALLAANVYNRVTGLDDDELRDMAMEKEVIRLVRFHRNLAKHQPE